jgi:hypothetical protein
MTQTVQDPPEVPPDTRWCDIRNVRVGVSECETSCAAPEQKPVCWLGRIYRDEPQEGGGG